MAQGSVSHVDCNENRKINVKFDHNKQLHGSTCQDINIWMTLFCKLSIHNLNPSCST